MTKSYREISNDAKAAKRGVTEQKERRPKTQKKGHPYAVVWRPGFGFARDDLGFKVCKCFRLEEAIKQCDKYRNSHSGSTWIEGPDVPPEYQQSKS